MFGIGLTVGMNGLTFVIGVGQNEDTGVIGVGTIPGVPFKMFVGTVLVRVEKHGTGMFGAIVFAIGVP
ncbi:MAG: hypothetical protein O7F76_10655 [Planctomycetota bacterium]|nr:hypothetical protein [Planctomycetota bacterium]